MSRKARPRGRAGPRCPRLERSPCTERRGPRLAARGGRGCGAPRLEPAPLLPAPSPRLPVSSPCGSCGWEHGCRAYPRSTPRGAARSSGKEPRWGRGRFAGLGWGAAPAPRPPAPGLWADRGRPQAGLATLPAPPLCLRSNPWSWGRGEPGGTRDGVLAGTLCLGVSRSPASASPPPAREGWSGGSQSRWPAQARVPGAQSPSWEGSSEPRERSGCRPCAACCQQPGWGSPSRPCPSFPPSPARAAGVPDSTRARCPRRPSARRLVSRRRQREEQDEALVISTPIPPTSCLPLGQQRGLGKLGPFAPGPAPTPALLMWNGVWVLPGYCLRWGRGQAGTGTSARSWPHQVSLWGFPDCLPHRMPPSP